MSSEEQFFLDQAGPLVEDGGEVLACGYFRTPIKGSGLSAFASVARAAAYFVALTPARLILIRTRAPATGRPLLENHEQIAIPRSEIERVDISATGLAIHAGDKSAVLAQTLANKYMPRQGQLIDALSRAHGDGRSIAELGAAFRRERLVRLAITLPLIAALIIAGILVGLYTR